MVFATPLSRSRGILAGFAFLAFFVTFVYCSCGGNDHYEYENKCHKFADEEKSYQEAQDECIAWRGNLASIRGKGKNDFLGGKCGSKKVADWWIGLKWNDEDGDSVWEGEEGDQDGEYFSTPDMTFEDARDFCRDAGAELASLHSRTEENTARRTCPSMPCWIGLYKESAEDDFEWLDGTEVDYTHWLGYQPHPEGTQPYVALWSSCGWFDTSGWTWFGKRKYHGVCRRPSGGFQYFQVGESRTEKKSDNRDCVAFHPSDKKWKWEVCRENKYFVCSRPSEECKDDSVSRLYAMKGYISDGPLSEPYSNNRDCSWVINPPGSNRVMITIDHFVSEENWDSLYIYDGPDASSPLIHKCNGGMNYWEPYINTCLPGSTFNSTGPVMTLVWDTDYCVRSEGFGLFYEGFGDRPCDHCHFDAFCLNDECVCKEGFTGDGFSCNDDDECADLSDNCDDNAACSDTHGSFECICNQGWRNENLQYPGVEGACVDIDECAEGKHECDSNAQCTDTDGSYDCTCVAGYEGDGFTACDTIDECVTGKNIDDCHEEHGTCIDTTGSFECKCNAGYQGNGIDCVNVDECESSTQPDNCHDQADCADTEGSFTCACKTGWISTSGAFPGVECADIDECAIDADNTCDTPNGNGFCEDNDGSFECGCNSGFTLVDGTTCKDVDECGSSEHFCDTIHGTCSNADGGFSCGCQDGWELPGASCTDATTCTCVDIDECSTTNHDCNTNADCTDKDGGYTCSCKWGWTGNGKDCSNINECGGTNDCNTNALCVDSQGSYSCPCKDGWSGDGWGNTGCSNVDECSLDDTNSMADNCDDQTSTCKDNEGSYECECKEGFVIEKKDVCKNLNECKNGYVNECDENAQCADTTGSYTCTCNAPGWVGNGTYCEDLDECAGNHGCDSNAHCINTLGSRNCECNDGWIGTGEDGQCSDELECVDRPESCDASHGVCENTEGSFECSCESGFNLDTNDNKTCIDVDECEVFVWNCTGAATCTNTDGSFVCDCYGTEIDMDTPCKYRCTEADEKKCHNLAFCEDGECTCFTGLIGDGYTASTGCQREGYTVRFTINLPETFPLDRVINSKLKTWDVEKFSFVELFDNVSVPLGFGNTLYHEVMTTGSGVVLVLNALFYDTDTAHKARDLLEAQLAADVKPVCFGVTLASMPENYPIEPRVYRWVAPTSSAEMQIAPTGMEVEQVYFVPTCGDAGCWAVDVIYTTGKDTFNTFFLPHAVGDESVPDFDYNVGHSEGWTTTVVETFLPNNHPCRTFDYVPDPNTPIPPEVTACCIPEFIAVYRPTATFVEHLNPFVVTECEDDGTIPLFMPGTEYPTRENATYTAKPVDHLTGKFKGLDRSYVEFTGVIDPFIRQYTATFYLDDTELRQKAGILRGSVGVEYTVDTFVGLANFKPTGIEFLDPFATQVNIHLERTQYFAVSTHGVNEYTFLQYVNMRLVAVYNEDTVLQDSADNADVTTRTDPTGAAHYVQVTFTLGDKYEPNSNSGLIPLDSVLAGQGVFITNPTVAGPGTAPGMFHACDQWSKDTFAGKDTFMERIPLMADRTEQLCAPGAVMCMNPLSIPDSFVSFNIPLGIDWYPASDVGQNVFVSIVVSAIDTDAQSRGTTPNAGQDPWQMKTTLTASIPVIRGGVNIFCDGIIAKTDLKEVADVDLIIGTAASEAELTRLTIFTDIASTDMNSVETPTFDTDSIESGFMTLVLKGNASYFGRNGGAGAYGLQLEDVITVHIMEDEANPVKFNAVKLLLADTGEDNFDTNNQLRTDGYKINGAFEVSIDTVTGTASLHPTAELFDECSYRPPRPSPADAFPTTCVLRRDVQARGYPSVSGAPATAMEVQPLRNSPTGALVGMYDASRNDNSDFMTTVLGESDYAKNLGFQYSYVVGERYQLNGQYLRAYWINPGYEWTPQQTGGRSKFTISQRIILVALVAIDEGFSGTRRRMLLQSDSADKLDDSQSGLAASVVSYDITRFNMMAQGFNVPVDNVVLMSVEMGLTDFQACMDEAALRPELRGMLDKAVNTDGVASAVETVQIVSMDVQKRGVECRRSSPQTGRRELGSSVARTEMMVVFSEAAEGDPPIAFDMQKFKAAEPSVKSVTPKVVSDAITIGEVTEVKEEKKEGVDDNLVLIVAVCAGVFTTLVLCVFGVWVVKRKKTTNVGQAVVRDGALIGDLQFNKAKLMEEAQDDKQPTKLSESEEPKRKSVSSNVPSLSAAEAKVVSRDIPIVAETIPDVKEPVGAVPPASRKESAQLIAPPLHAPVVEAAPVPAPVYVPMPKPVPVTEDSNGISFTHPGYENEEYNVPEPVEIPKPDHVPLPSRLTDQVYIATPDSAIQRAIGSSGLPEPPMEEAPSNGEAGWNVMGLFGAEQKK